MRVPAGAWDCHTHVFGPYDKFPLDPGRAYTPAEASLDALRAHLDRTGPDHVVLVQPDSYGTDTRALTDGLDRLGPGARGVIVIDPEPGAPDPSTAHDPRVRGVRLNLRTAGTPEVASARRRLRSVLDRLDGTGWHLQLFASASMLSALEPDLLAARSPVVLDHMGLALTAPRGGSVLELVSAEHVWIKLSAAERMGTDPAHRDVEALVQRIADLAPGRTLWGSDWPHTAIHHEGPLQRPEPFRVVDDRARLELLSRWLGPAAFERMLVDNPRRLYDADADAATWSASRPAGLSECS